ncbi:hypothetical protein [Mesorhizobium sp. 131-2-1]|uniref:hypothetical protein n=1 Tax=Mesorhizobium sp. 131-2-1 TaxID=2744518 RepID=UPI00192873CE|nr:hypothetical protein [Mesorhizobium sp. 131-2-1]BCG92583.1 hypothetical protein MesoLj131a_14470 [Mesorhizobium sp. 131-2-1]
MTVGLLTEVIRKAAQEVEIDHLLAEEFYCDPAFGQRFLAACGLTCNGFEVLAVKPEFSLAGEGFGDLLVEGSVSSARVGLLIEDKITAGPAVRQALRYRAFAEQMRSNRWDIVWTILAAPDAYRGERELYDATVSLEKVAELMTGSDLARLTYRRGIIHRALQKSKATGVQVPDARLHQLKKEYLEHIVEQCLARNLPFVFPKLRDSYFDGDSWIAPIADARLPAHVKLRHRLWISVAKSVGQIDLISSPATELDRKWFADARPDGALFSRYSEHKGVQISVSLPEMRQASGFSKEIAAEAILLMDALTKWYLQLR